MEKDTNIHQLTFNKGMGNALSDSLCPDDELRVEVDMVWRGGEHHPVQEPSAMFSGAVTPAIVYVHRTSAFVHYVALQKEAGDDVYTLCWFEESDGGITPITSLEGIKCNSVEGVSITSIGNTLIVSDDAGINYFVWDVVNVKYKFLGDKVPEPKLEFSLVREVNGSTLMDARNDASVEGIVSFDLSGIAREYDFHGIDAGRQDDYNNLVVGLYSKNMSDIKKDKKAFANPFFIRYAVELYDGSYTNISVPILLFPGIWENSFVSAWYDSDVRKFRMATQYRLLLYKATLDYEGWEDIVKDVVVFVSDEVDIHNTDADQLNPNRGIVSSPDIQTHCIATKGMVNENGQIITGSSSLMLYESTQWGGEGKSDIIYVLKPKSEAQMLAELESVSVFYRLFSVGLDSTGWVKASDKIRDGDMENLTTLEQLDDDYYSHCPVSAEFLYVYNSRLNLAGVLRGFYDGPEVCMYYDSETTRDYESYVYIKTNSGNRIVKHDVFTSNTRFDLYYFYPDPRAYKVDIFYGDAMQVSLKLKEHPFLNGAYYLKIPTGLDTEVVGSVVEKPVANESPEKLNNQVWTSEVNNPFSFTSAGDNTIGTGTIIGIATQTTAISQGQFGEFPLIVFSTDGIWAMSVDDKGLYSSVRPLSREICNNAKSITGTDGAVFFSSAKGLMVIVGNDVRCVSEQLSGKDMAINGYAKEVLEAKGIDYIMSLRKYIAGDSLHIAYDYRDSMLWICNAGLPYSFIYSIKDGTFAIKAGATFINAVNDYPDSLLADSTGPTYSLMRRPNINDDGKADYSGVIVSRALKLDNAFVEKSVRQLMNVSELAGGSITLYMYGSQDCVSWHEIRSLRGHGWKFLELQYMIGGMKATDTFGGTIIVTQQRKTNKLR